MSLPSPCHLEEADHLMTELIADPRVIEADAPQYNATLVRRVDQTDDLAIFWVRYDGDPVPFEPGQYMTIGVFADGKLWQRPYSVASAPRDAGDGGYEFYVRLVPIIRFTTLLWRLPIGHGMRMIGPKGKFLLEPERPPHAPVHLHRDRHRPLHVDDPPDAGRRPPAQDRRPPRLLVRGGAGLPRRARGLAARWHLPADLRPHDLATDRPAQRGLDGAHRAAPRTSSRTCARTSACARTRRSSTSAATPT